MYLLQLTKQILLHMLLLFTLTKCFKDSAPPLLFWILWRYNILNMFCMFCYFKYNMLFCGVSVYFCLYSELTLACKWHIFFVNLILCKSIHNFITASTVALPKKKSISHFCKLLIIMFHVFRLLLLPLR